ncbi:chorismate-binding protein [Tenacibaculum aestuariivivum]|uniref:chorismate-binding protein n=1 Tax=Tenacibaculum aestuariivivum TaxID=2006131 RepID=UPI003AB7C301
MTIFLKIKNSLDNKLPFVVYRKPNSTTLNGWFQNNDKLHTSKNYTESGFIFAPFDDKNIAVLLPEEDTFFLQEKFDIPNPITKKNNIATDYLSEKEHIKLVKKGIKAIKDGLFKKVILSRKEKVVLKDFNTINVFKKLLTNYSTAFTYIWFHPKVGMWLGATPETLVKITDNSFETMALAGTQVFKGTTNVTWQSKEIEEQQFVTDYITDKLSEICNQLEKSNLKTVKAGNLLHLRTFISGKITTKNSTLIKKLHPTPAVCGLPLEESKAFIIKNETYNRSYYAGFLGELNLKEATNKTSELFVNLRCMEIKNNTAFVYVGGGITKDSDAKNEWLETVAKTTTMKKVL